MRARALAVAMTILVLVAVSASAADVTGKWVAQVAGRQGTQEVTFNLKMAGGKLTGTMTTGQGEQAISDGQVTGDSISFVIVQSRGGNDVKNLYKGTVSGTEMKLTRTREGGGGGGGRGGQPQEIVAKKVG